MWFGLILRDLGDLCSFWIVLCTDGVDFLIQYPLNLYKMRPDFYQILEDALP